MLKKLNITIYNETNYGQPVSVNKIKCLDYELFGKLTKEDIEEFYFLLCERNQRIVMPLLSYKYGKRIDNIINIIDLEDVSLMTIFSKVILYNKNRLEKIYKRLPE